MILNTPVALFVFNRPETTSRVFAEIRNVKPAMLFIIADAPRKNMPGDVNRCTAVQEIVSVVDWPCKVLTNYAETNMGCKERLISGLDWVFSQVSEAIILEDDCLPHPCFFRYCEEMLDRYRNDERIMMISGNNYLFGAFTIPDSYYFSSFTHIWGWATWARTWSQFDPDMHEWPDVLATNRLSVTFPDSGLRKYWERIFEFSYRGIISTWDVQLNYSCIVNKGLAVVPCVNLVTNIGFGSDATSTRASHLLAEVPFSEITFPLVHPKAVEMDFNADLAVAKKIYFRPLLPLWLATLLEKIKRTLSYGS